MTAPGDKAGFRQAVTRLWSERRYDEAASLARRRLAATPEDPDAHQALCHSLASVGRIDEAVTAGRQGVALDPGSLGARHVLAEALTLGARLDEAVEVYDDALRLRPDDAATAALKASVLTMSRRYPESRALLTPHLAAEAPDARVIVAFADLAPALNEEPAAIDLLRRTVERTDLHPQHLSQCLFRLGRLLDRADDHDAAFAAYERANHTVQTSYRHRERTELVDDLIEAWNPRTMRRAARFGSGSRQPVIIIKMPRSGSTLVEQILA
ncbi:MAG: tetratricopeptide repeat protein, partial [Phycisphaerales bacterium]|nr:tetratricopeptide repeat protein [Phycisphaerales bacterium]